MAVQRRIDDYTRAVKHVRAWREMCVWEHCQAAGNLDLDTRSGLIHVNVPPARRKTRRLANWRRRSRYSSTHEPTKTSIVVSRELRLYARSPQAEAATYQRESLSNDEKLTAAGTEAQAQCTPSHVNNSRIQWYKER